MKKVFIFTVFSILCLTGHAQHVDWGVTAGLNVNKVAGEVSSSGARVGWHVGGIMNYRFADSDNGWYVGAQPLLTQKGYKTPTMLYEDGKSKNNSMEGHTDMTYFELPLVGGKNFRLGEASRLFVEAGPYLGIGLWGKAKMETNGVKTYSTSKVFGHEGFRRFDCGLTVGVGIQAFEHLGFRLGYEHGLVNLQKWDASQHKGTVKPTYYNRNLTFSMAYTF